MSGTERVLVVCPGRGSYTPEELGTLTRDPDLLGTNEARRLLETADRLRRAAGRPTITELDGAERFSARLHMAGEHASALTFTLSALDWLRVRRRHRAVVVTGNSMGWYTALFVSGAFEFEEAFRLVETMGGWQAGRRDRGGQIVYPIVDDSWHPSPEREDAVRRALEAANADRLRAWVSIELGGHLVLAGTEDGLRILQERLPAVAMGRTRYPFRLAGHAAFHTPLLAPMGEAGREALRSLRWRAPRIPAVDGRGYQWRPWSADPAALFQYTLGTQVVETYRFTTAVRVALREYAPDRIVLLGPGAGLGGPIGQILVQEGWNGIRDKEAFKARQAGERPILLTTGAAARVPGG